MNTEQQARAAFDAKYGALSGVTGVMREAFFEFFKAGWDARAEQPATEQPKADDGWIPWAGGPPNVPDGTRGDIKLRNGDILRSDWLTIYRWSHTNSDDDIIAYRISRGTV